MQIQTKRSNQIDLKQDFGPLIQTFPSLLPLLNHEQRLLVEGIILYFSPNLIRLYFIIQLHNNSLKSCQYSLTTLTLTPTLIQT